MSLNDESPLLPKEKGNANTFAGYERTGIRAGGGGAGLLLYGAMDSPLQSIDIAQCSACIDDASEFSPIPHCISIISYQFFFVLFL